MLNPVQIKIDNSIKTLACLNIGIDWGFKSPTVLKSQKPGFHSSEAGFFTAMIFSFLP